MKNTSQGSDLTIPLLLTYLVSLICFCLIKEASFRSSINFIQALFLQFSRPIFLLFLVFLLFLQTQSHPESILIISMFISTFTAFTAGLVYFELNSYVFMAQTEPSVSEPNLAKTEKLLRYGIGIMV